MAFGLRVYGADGAVQINENSFTMRVVFTTTVDNNGWTQSGPSPNKGHKQWAVDANASNSVAFVIPDGEFQMDYTTQFETEMLDGVVRVYNHNRGWEYGLTANAASMRLFVVRFA